MRKPSDDLFRLIKSMSGAEKGYFKKMSAQSSGNDNTKYLKLFDLLDSQPASGSYDESLVRKGFKNDSFINNLHVAKGHLYKNILKSLTHYHSGNSISITISELYNGALILYKRGLYKESQFYIDKCKNLIYKNNAEEFLFPVLKLERYLISIYMGNEVETFFNISGELGAATEKMNNIKIYNELFAKLLQYYKKNQIIRNKKETVTPEELFKDPFLKNEDLATSVESKILFNKIYYNFSLSVSDDKELYKYSKKMIAILENSRYHKNELLHDYIFILNSYLTSVTFLRKYKEGEEVLSKLRQIEFTTPHTEHLICIIVYNFELIKFIHTGEFQMGIRLVPEIERTIGQLEENKKPLRHKFNYSIAYLYFGAGKYEKTIEWLNKIFNDNASDIRQDLLSFAHMLNLITHAELNDSDYLFYTIKNTYRSFSRRKKLFKVETAVLNFLRRSPKAASAEELMPHFKELKLELEEIVQDPFEKIALDYFDFISWLESKITGKPFAEIVKSKATGPQ